MYSRLINNKYLLFAVSLMLTKAFLFAENDYKGFSKLPIVKYEDFTTLIRANVEKETFSQKLIFLVRGIKKRYPDQYIPVMVQADLLNILVPMSYFTLGKEIPKTHGRIEANVEEVLGQFSVMTKTTLKKMQMAFFTSHQIVAII